MNVGALKDDPRRKAVLYVSIFLIFELVIRVLLQPDPWLLEPAHWYFQQPLRLLIEVGLVVILASVIVTFSKRAMSFDRSQWPLLIIASVGCIVVFSLMELDQLVASFAVGFLPWFLWLLTGFFIGVGQELLYRGLLYEAVCTKLTGAKANAVIAVLFVFMPLHSVRMVTYLFQGEVLVVLILVAVYTAASMLFFWLRERTDSVAVPSIVHGLGNAVTWVAVFAAF